MAKEQPIRTTKQVIEDHAPWKPAPVTTAEHLAVKAVFAGTADAEQQKRAMEWILDKACILKEQHFYPGEDGRRNTDMALGRAFVGKQIARLLTTNPRRNNESEMA